MAIGSKFFEILLNNVAIDPLLETSIIEGCHKAPSDKSDKLLDSPSNLPCACM